MKVVVIGGGASGLICAIRLAKRGKNVEILEKNSNVCKKVLITGNGKCNYFNSDMNISHYRSDDLNSLKKLVNEDNCQKVLDFFEGIGVIPRIKNGYYYPYSNTSTTIKNLLLLEANKLNIKVTTDIIVTNIIKRDKFTIKTNKNDIICDKVVLSTGSNASIKDNDYNGYDILKEMGHTIIKPLPALVMLVGNGNYFKDWAGIRCDAEVELYDNNKFVDKQIGEVQLTNYGISGICVMNLSGRVARLIDEGSKVSLRINFIPFVEKEDGYNYLEKRNKLIKNRTIIELLESIINYKLLYVILKKCHIDTKLTWNELSEKQKKTLVDNLFDFKLDIIDTKGVESSQVVSGGLTLKEVTNNLESKIVSDLYITGELLNVDGDCGGYNLGFAWITGMIVGDTL